MVANAWHHRCDALSSVVATVGIGLALLGFPILDSIAGGCVGLMIAKTGGEMIVESIGDLTDRSDPEVISSVEAMLSEMPGIFACKSVRHRQMGPSQVVDADVLVSAELSLSAVEDILAGARVTLQEEMPSGTDIMLRPLAYHVSSYPVQDCTSDRSRAPDDAIRSCEIEENVRQIVKYSVAFTCKGVETRFTKEETSVVCTIGR